MSPWAFRVYYTRGSRCWKMFYLSDIIALTLAGKEERENYAAFKGAICHHPFFFFFSPLSGRPSLLCLSVCLFICFFFFFCSPVLKGDESILCFSVWEKFQQQTFCSPPLFTGAKRSSAIFAAGETRRGEASGNARSLARSMFGCWWRWGRCEKINGFVLYRLAAVQKPSLIFTFPPPEKKYTHIEG